MKHMSKIFALALALVLMLSLATTASAYTISMAPSDSGAGVAGHTYEVYQIYTGTMAEIDGEETLGEVKYGQDYAGKTAGDPVPEAELTEISLLTGPAAAEHFAALVDETPIATLNDANAHKVENMPAGYYLIIDVSEDLPETETSSAFILEVIDDTAINSKHNSTPITEKKIDDKNDSTHDEDEIQWHDSADHDIGDDISFKLEVTIPSAIESFQAAGIAYPFTFHDTEEQGLSFNNDAKVYVDGKEITTGFTVDVDPEDGHSFDVIFADLTQISAVKSGSTISVIYTSELTEQAILGNQGNVNEVFGEFRNYAEPEVPAYTPKDTVIAFTYKVVVNKVDEDGQPLTGATFTLEKFVANENGTEEYKGLKGNWVALETVEAEPEDVFTFKGLDDGEYRLTEAEAPAGYNKIAPVEFTVTAEHNIKWETEKREDILTSLTGNVVTGKLEFTTTEDLSTLSTDVENKAGVVLPSTGGIGTTIFYIVGGLLAVAAVILLVTKKRMKSAE